MTRLVGTPQLQGLAFRFAVPSKSQPNFMQHSYVAREHPLSAPPTPPPQSCNPDCPNRETD